MTRLSAACECRFSAVVAGTAEDGAALPVGELVNIPLCDVVQGETQEVCQDRRIPKYIAKFGGHVVTIKLREVTVLVADQFLDLLGNFARLTHQTEDQVYELVRGTLVARRTQRGTLVVVAFHGATVAITHSRRSEPKFLSERPNPGKVDHELAPGRRNDTHLSGRADRDM